MLRVCAVAYHVFKLNTFRQLTYIESVEGYADAKTLVRELRKQPDIEPGTTYRMMFATDQHQAERLLKEKREPRPMGEHD